MRIESKILSAKVKKPPKKPDLETQIKAAKAARDKAEAVLDKLLAKQVAANNKQVHEASFTGAIP